MKGPAMTLIERLKQTQESDESVDLHKIAVQYFNEQRRFIRVRDIQREALEKIQRKVLERSADERE